jgi:RNA polymerase sporulation-specific sigma factor
MRLFNSTDIVLQFMREILLLASYIEKGNYFPQPLSPEEESKYIERHLNGDIDARQVLIERNLRLVVHVAKKYHGCGKDMDDLISIGTIGLIKAVNTYNRKKGTQLATYAARCIDNEILMTIRSSKKEKNEVYIQEPIGVDKEGNEISLIDVLGTGQDDIVNEVDLKLQMEKLDELIKKHLNDRERKVIFYRFGLGGCKRLTQREIGKLLGISRSYVSRIEKKAIEILNELLPKSVI